MNLEVKIEKKKRKERKKKKKKKKGEEEEEKKTNVPLRNPNRAVLVFPTVCSPGHD